MSGTQAALANVERLGQMLEDNQPGIQPFPNTVAVPSTTFDTRFADAELYAIQGNLAIEARFMRKLRLDVQEASVYFGMIYACRSCSKALPQVKSQDQPDREEIYRKTHDILRPEVAKMKEYMRFSNRAIGDLVEVVKYLADVFKKNKEPIISEPLLLAMSQLMNYFSLLDNMKNMKTAWNNDFAMYKRACTNLKKMDESETMENQKLYLFLANHDSISAKLRTDVSEIEGFVEPLTSIVNVCVDYYEQDMYVLPQEKYGYLRTIAFGLSMIDGNDEKTSILKNKRIKLDRALRILKGWPVIPLMGDMQMSLSAYMKHAPHIEESQLQPQTEDETLRLQNKYQISTSLDQEVARFKEYSSKLTIFSNQFRETENWDNINIDGLALLYDGLKLLSSWTTQIIDQSAWKYAHPADKYLNRSCPADAGEYEKLVKYNYSMEEQYALIEFVSMIKSISSQIQRLSSKLGPYIRRTIHKELFAFMQHTLLDVISHSVKKKKSSQGTLIAIRDLILDVAAVVEAQDDEDKKKKKGASSSNLGQQQPVVVRSCPPASTQLQYFRVLLESLFNEKAAGMKGSLLKGKDYSNQEVDDMIAFYRRSFTFPYLLDLGRSLTECSDLSELWFKEFYLEITRSVQFPIEQSLPWILTETIIDSGNMTEFIFITMDLYNDSASRALWDLKSRYLFDEIEAEVNLCFDALLFKVSQAIFIHYKTQASAILLDKKLKNALTGEKAMSRLDAPKNRYATLLRQRHVQLLGRTIDFAQLMSQRMNRLLRQSIEAAIVRFEAHDFGTGIMELEGLLNNARLTHRLLSEYLPLDPFEDMLRQVDDSIDITQNNGRILSHVIFQILYDFLPNFSFSSGTQQFVRAPIELGHSPFVKEPMPKPNHTHLYGNRFFFHAMSHVHEPFKDSIGLQQIATIIRVIGQDKIAVLMDELLKNMEIQIVNIVQPYVASLIRGIPYEMKTPIFMYGTKGTYQYFQALLKPLLTYRDLKTEVFHVLRELGNSLIFARLLDQSMVQADLLTSIQSMPFYNMSKKGVATPSTDAINPNAFSNLISAHLAGQPLSQSLSSRADIASKLSMPSLSRKSLFVRVLERFDSALDPVRSEWRGSRPNNGVLCIDETSEFYRLWSALQFAFCTPGAKTEFSTQQLFGEGLQWTGIAIIYLLGQRCRFQALDFNYHMLNLFAVDNQGGNIGSFTIEGYLELVKHYQRLNDSIFSTLRALIPQRDVSNMPHGISHPPLEPGKIPTYIPSDGEHGTAASRKVDRIEAGGSSSHDTRV